jgi:hypothetical protein
MGIESAATFLVCTILLGCGVIVLVGIVLLINNLLHRYWKDLNWNLPESMRPMRYPHEQEHNLDRSQEPPLDRK